MADSCKPKSAPPASRKRKAADESVLKTISDVGENVADKKPTKRIKGVKDEVKEEMKEGAEIVVKTEASFITATRSLIGSTNKTAVSARWGHSLSLMSDSTALMIGGQGDRSTLSKDAVWHLDLVRGQWTVPETVAGGSSLKPEVRMGHTAVYDPLLRSVYLFGGTKIQRWFSDVHVLDLDDFKWRLVQANGKAPTRAYHSCTLYSHELWIFGGIYPRPDPTPDSCSNEILVFSPIEESWYTPIVMGTKPSARSGHSATLLVNRLVVFGGWDAPTCYNDVHILDMSLVEWSQPRVTGTPPAPRSWHASCALAGNRVLIHGGFNGDIALSDAFIFNLDALTWTPVRVAPPVPARTGHTALCLPHRHEDPEDDGMSVPLRDEVVVFGGGDNEGHFFGDLIGLSIPWGGGGGEGTLG